MSLFFHRRIAGVSLLFLLLLVALPGWAQPADKLPPAPGYRGEIRRGPDGRLVAVGEEIRPLRAAELPATMLVGPGEKVSSLTAAAAAARDGEVIEIRPGSYRGQPVVWTQNNLTIRGAAGQRPVMLADGKALWIVRGGKVTIQGVEFRGARAAEHNGAAIRLEKGELSIVGCAFFDNETGIVTSNQPELSLEIVDSEFGEAPHDRFAAHHLLDVGTVGQFVLRGSRLQNGYLGNLVRSRARESRILYNMLVDGAEGKATLELEFPNGGIAYVIGNAIGQSAGSENDGIVAYGSDGSRWPENALYMAHNTLINDAPAGSFLTVRSDRIADAEVWLLNNLTVGNGDFFPPAQGRFDGNRTLTRGELIESEGIPLRLTNLSPLRGDVRPPGQARGVDLLPDAEFRFPVGTRPLRPGSALAPGGFQ